MADEIEVEIGQEDPDIEVDLDVQDLTDGLPKKKINGKVIVMAAAGAVMLIVLVVALSSLFGGEEEKPAEGTELLAQQTAKQNEDKKRQASQDVEEIKLLFVKVGDGTYNLRTDGQGNSFLRMTLQLELDRESHKKIIEAQMARVKDEITVFLREVRPSDLNGAAGIFRLKEELLMRINQAVAPAWVKDVLFQDFVVQG